MDRHENINFVRRNKTIVGWNKKLKQNDDVSTWFRQRKLYNARFNTKVPERMRKKYRNLYKIFKFKTLFSKKRYINYNLVDFNLMSR